MAWGCEAWDKDGNSVVTTMKPFNLLQIIKPQLGTHTVTITLPPSSSLEIATAYQVSGGASTQMRFDSISVSGNQVTYTAKSDSRSVTTTGLAILCFAKR